MIGAPRRAVPPSRAAASSAPRSSPTCAAASTSRTCCAVLDELDAATASSRKVLFLEADEETLLDRYKETRRRHPLAPEGRIVEGIRAERELLAPLRERADVVMDTTDLTGGELRRRIADRAARPRREGKLALTLLTFGFKNGPPRDADLTLDVRFLPNPLLRRRAAAADRPRRGGPRLRRVGDPGRRVLRPPDAAARVPAARLRRRGQEPPDDRDRLHRRPPPLGHRRRPDPPRPRPARDDVIVRVKHRDVELGPSEAPAADGQ